MRLWLASLVLSLGAAGPAMAEANLLKCAFFLVEEDYSETIEELWRLETAGMAWISLSRSTPGPCGDLTEVSLEGAWLTQTCRYADTTETAELSTQTLEARLTVDRPAWRKVYRGQCRPPE